jgi:uncharacterized membrane protein YdbT with pleckstrin-like domain
VIRELRNDAEEGPVAYPDDLLSADEQVIVHRHPHWKMLVVPVVVMFAVVAGGTYLAALVGATSWREPGWIGLGVLSAVLFVWLVLAPLIRWRSTHFVVTTHRLMVREGVLSRSGIDIPMSRINSVRFRHGLIDRLVGCGTLIVESASDDPLEFDDIPNVERVHTLLYREVYADSDEEHPARREE